MRAAREANADMPAYTVGPARGARTATWPGASVAVLGASYRGGVKETAFSGVFATVEALRAKGADVYVHDPMYTADELTALGLRAVPPRRAGRRRRRPGRPRRIPDLAPADLPGVGSLVDGRRVTDPTRVGGVTRRVIGAP